MHTYKTIKEEIFCDVEYYYQVIRKNIKFFRLSQNLTQQELADLSGLSRGYICDIENIKRNKHISISTLIKISCALNQEIKELFNDKYIKTYF